MIRKICALCCCLIAAQCSGSLYTRGDAYLAEQKYDDAVAEFKNLIELYPGDYIAMVRLGDACRGKRDFDAALTAYDSALRIRKDCEEARQKRLETYLEKAQSLAGTGDERIAIEIYEQAAREYPEDARAYKPLAACYEKSGQPGKAKDTLERFLKKNPGDPDAAAAVGRISDAMKETDRLYDEALAEYKKGMFYEAAETLKRVVERRPYDAEARYYRYLAEGRSHLRRGTVVKMLDAIEAFRNASMIKSDRQEPFFYMARAYEKKDKNDYDTPISLYQQVIELDPASALAEQSRQKIKTLTETKKKMEAFLKKKKGKGGGGH